MLPLDKHEGKTFSDSVEHERTAAWT